MLPFLEDLGDVVPDGLGQAVHEGVAHLDADVQQGV